MLNDETVERADPKTVGENVRNVWRNHGFRAHINEENKQVTVFAQRNAWNRLGAYVVHAALLTIFIGGFLTSRYGVGGAMEIQPGKTSNAFATREITVDGGRESQSSLPFQIECMDLEQKLIRPKAPSYIEHDRLVELLRSRTEPRRRTCLFFLTTSRLSRLSILPSSFRGRNARQITFLRPGWRRRGDLAR